MVTINDQLEAVNKRLEELTRKLEPEKSETESDISKLEAQIFELKELIQKPIQVTDSDVNETPEYLQFKQKRMIAIVAAFLFLGFATIAAFKWFLPVMPFTMGCFVVLIGILLWLFLDKYIFYGHSLKKISGNAIAISVCVLAIALLFNVGFQFGNSYLSNPYGHPESVGSNIEQQQQGSETKPAATDTASRGVGIVFPERSGKP